MNEVARFRAASVIRQQQRNVSAKPAKVVPIRKPHVEMGVCANCGGESPPQLLENEYCVDCREMTEVSQTAQESPEDLKDLLKRFVSLQKRRWILEHDLGLVLDESETVNEQLQEKYAEIGIKSLKYGNATIYLKGDYYVGPKDENLKLADIQEQVVEACEQIGLEWLVKETVNAKSLSAYINECKREKREIPEQLLELLEINPKYKVRVTGLGKASVIAEYEQRKDTDNGNDNSETSTDEDSIEIRSSDKKTHSSTKQSSGTTNNRSRTGTPAGRRIAR